MADEVQAIVESIKGFSWGWKTVAGIIAFGSSLVFAAQAKWKLWESQQNPAFWLEWAYGLAALSVVALFFALFRANLNVQAERQARAQDRKSFQSEEDRLNDEARRVHALVKRAETLLYQVENAPVPLPSGLQSDVSAYLAEGKVIVETDFLWHKEVQGKGFTFSFNGAHGLTLSDIASMMQRLEDRLKWLSAKRKSLDPKEQSFRVGFSSR